MSMGIRTNQMKYTIIYIYRISDVTWINYVPIPLLKKSTSTNPTRVWAAGMSWSTNRWCGRWRRMATHGDAWRRMATHGDALRKAFPWHWAVILGITRMFPKVGDDFMIFHVTSTIFHPKFRASEYHLGNLVDFLFFFRCPKLRNWPPDATAIEFRTARPPSGLRGVCQCQRCCQKDAWEMTILHL
jgi:hypothetical protein